MYTRTACTQGKRKQIKYPPKLVRFTDHSPQVVLDRRRTPHSIYCSNLLPVKVLSRLFRRLKLEMLLAAHDTGRLQFFGDHAHLADKTAFKAYLAPLHRTKWFVYSKWPFAGPEQVLAYLSRYTHRVAISNSRLIAADATGVTFRYKDYRIKGPGRRRRHR